MSDYKQFLQEREQIDGLVGKGYKIKSIIENLSGATVEFENGNGDREILKVLSPDGRKYFSVLLIRQQKEAIK